MDKSETIGKLALALSKLQGEIHDAFKGSKGRNHSYADLEACLKIARPLMLKYELSISQLPQNSDEKGINVHNILMHSSGEWLSSVMFMPIVKIVSNQGKEVINVAQQLGSAISYARRYCLCSILGYTQTEDDNDADSFTQDDTPKFKQAAELPAPAIEMIGDPELIDLRKLIEQAGRTEENICTHCKIQSLNELTMASYEKMSKILFTKILEKEENDKKMAVEE